MHGDPKSANLIGCFMSWKRKTEMFVFSRAVYTALSNQRLRELEDLLRVQRKEYEDLFKDIELILSGKMDDQLLEVSENIEK